MKPKYSKTIYRSISIQISRNSPLFKRIDELCYLSKSMYNSALYKMREDFDNKKFEFDSNHYNKELRTEKIYGLLPKNSSMQVVQLVYGTFVSYFEALDAYKKNPTGFKGKPRLPKFKDKTKGRNVLRFTSQQFTIKDGNKIGLSVQRTGLPLIKMPNLAEGVKYQEAELIPHHSHYTLKVVYKINPYQLLKDNGGYASIDLGIDNLATVTSNLDEPGCEPFLITGKIAKSINGFYYKS